MNNTLYNGLILLDRGSDAANGNGIYYPWTPVANQWYHIAVTRAGEKVTLYVNGTQVAQKTPTAPHITAVTTTFKLAHRHTTGTNYLRGGLDEVYFFNSALPAATVAKLYTNSATLVDAPVLHRFESAHTDAASGTYGVALNTVDGAGKVWFRTPTGAWLGGGNPETGAGGAALNGTPETQWWLYARLPDASGASVTTRTLPARAEQSPITHLMPNGFKWYTYSDNLPERRATFGFSAWSAESDAYLTKNGAFTSVTAASAATVSTAQKTALFTDLVFDSAFSVLWLWRGVDGSSLYSASHAVSFVVDSPSLPVDSSLNTALDAGTKGWYQNTHATLVQRQAVMFVAPGGTNYSIQYAGTARGNVAGTLASLQSAGAPLDVLWVAFTRDASGVMNTYFSGSTTMPTKTSQMTPGSVAMSGYQAPGAITSRLRIVLNGFNTGATLNFQGPIKNE
eukprot:jgi/Mesvir1/20141/Mv13380-RA.1